MATVAKRPALTETQRDQIATLRGEQGMSCAAIAKRLDVSEGSVAWFCLIEGIEKPGAAIRAFKGPMVAMRSGH